MFQLEIYEYMPKMSDLYSHFYNTIQNSIDLENHHSEKIIDNKFLKIKHLRHPLISRYIEHIKEDSNLNMFKICLNR